MSHLPRFCPQCATPLEWISQLEDGGAKERLRCPGCGYTPMGGIAREVKEETNLDCTEVNLVGVYDFQRMNQVIIAYHVVAQGTVELSPELAEYRLFDYPEIKCWPAGTGYALAEWLKKAKGIEPVFVDWSKR
jgi:NAD+ diphosphatase